jgi:2-polyprenyl-3-methyl-5-hydroxy-6-metoxy-1,4-benzoquinol methylase
MDQTPVHDSHNPDLLNAVPLSSQQIIEIGCSSGALAREVKKRNPSCNYFGVDIDAEYTKLAERYCDKTEALNIENADEEFFLSQTTRDCWIFGDTLEHFQDPWSVLRKIRAVIPANGCIVACIPNAQHWSVQVKLSLGDFRYEDSGLMDRTHLRWFTKQTIADLFRETGFCITEGTPRIFNEPMREKFLPIIGSMAEAAGFDATEAINNSLPMQYVVTAIPF